MSKEFEWRFGDELPEGQNDEQRYSRRGWRRWLPWLLALLLVVGGAYIWWRERQQTLAEVEVQVEQIARLELRALTEGDEELYLSLQDPADRSWKEAQANYLDTAGLPLPLHGLTKPISTSVESARIVGDRAEVEIVHTTMLPSGEEGSFRAVRFYRYTGDGRWLHTRMDPDYGGHLVIFISDDVEITILSNDSISLDALARRLAALPDRFCRLATCRQHLLLSLGFTRDSEEAQSMAKVIGIDTTLSLNLAANLEEAADPNDAVLPAPLLVGAPNNAAAQAAWEASLSQFLVDYLMTEEIGPRPPDDHKGALFEERFRLWLKAELGVREPVSPDLELVQQALKDGEWIPLWRLWLVPPDDSDRHLAAAEIDLLLAFIKEERGRAAVADLLDAFRIVDRTEALLDEIAGGRGDVLEEGFPPYVREQLAPATDDLGAFARYDLVIGCSEWNEPSDVASLWGCQVDQSEPVLLFAERQAESLMPVSWSPDGTRLALLPLMTPVPGESLYLLYAGSDVLDPVATSPGARLTDSWSGQSGWSPDGTRLAYHAPGDSRQPSSSAEMRTEVMDLDSGDRIAFDGRFVAWSPTGSRLLYAESEGSSETTEARLPELATRDFVVAHTDGTRSQSLGEGYAAAWSPDGEEIVTISSEYALVVHELATAREATLLNQDELREALDFTRPYFTIYQQAFQLAWSPDGDWIALGATEGDEETGWETAVLLASIDDHRLLHKEPGGVMHYLAWAPNGRWLSTFVWHREEFWSRVVDRRGTLVFDEENTLVTWSPRAEYAVLSHYADEGSGIQLVDMTNRQRLEIDVPGHCYPAVWNPQGPGLDAAP
jgi:Tol biopolymer transport system component